jgi:hypothetical protein
MANCPKVHPVDSWLCCFPRCYITRRESQEPSFFPSQGNRVKAIPPLPRSGGGGMVFTRFPGDDTVASLTKAGTGPI